MGEVAAVAVLGVLDHSEDLSGEAVAHLRQCGSEVSADVEQYQPFSRNGVLQVTHHVLGRPEPGAVERVTTPAAGGLSVRRLVDALGLGEHGA
ncbi:hypothetical protein [Nocardiopsis dassonvillei]|uniref:hypothetical protein n=1 Tax=Nocardiopsis dassonvillei TaxID=2014 RepID=UPI003633B5AF